MNFDINMYCVTALLLIKPYNIAPRLLFVPARQLMSPTLSQQETKAQRTHCTFKESETPSKNCLEESDVSKMTGVRSHWEQKKKKSKQPSSSSSYI